MLSFNMSMSGYREQSSEVDDDDNSDSKSDNSFDLFKDVLEEGNKDQSPGTLSSKQTMSDITTTSSISQSLSFSRGSKGVLIKHHLNSRKKKSHQELMNDLFKTFAKDFFNGDLISAASNIDLFKKAGNSNSRYAILAAFIHRKEPISQYMATRIFGCGVNCFNIAKNLMVKGKQGGSLRPDHITSEQIDQISRMLDPDGIGALPLELGFACAHGRQEKAATSAKTWYDVYAHYINFEVDRIDLNKMAFKTFHRYVRGTQPDFRLRATKTNACDVC